MARTREPEYSPGPWTIERAPDVRKDEVGISSKDHGLLAQVIWKMEDHERSPKCEANAKLIAAAPDLFESLRELLPLVEEHALEFTHAIKRGRAALRRAVNG